MSCRPSRPCREAHRRPSFLAGSFFFALIADHDIEQLEEILDAHRVIERMAEAGSEPVAIPDDDLD